MSISHIENFFRMKERNSRISVEVFAGITTFLTMSYIIILQPLIMSGGFFGMDTGMDFSAMITTVCIASAFGCILMGLLANYPIGLAPGMGENIFFTLTVLPGCASVMGMRIGMPQVWQTALGIVFISGLLFCLISFLNVRRITMDAISPGMKAAIACGIGIFIAFIGIRNCGLIEIKDSVIHMTDSFRNLDILVFCVGLFVTAVLIKFNIRGGIFLGIIAGTFAALISGRISLVIPFGLPPNPMPVFAKMDLAGVCTHFIRLFPLILIFVFMDVFDTLGCLVALGTQAGLMKNNQLPNAKRAFASDATATLFGSFCGHSTVTAYIESATGIATGGRTGLTAVVTGLCFIAALFFAPFVRMVSSCPAICAPALVIVGIMMMKSVSDIEWEDTTEALPAFLVVIGIPLSYSIADGMALGFITYPLLKLFTGKAREAGWLSYILAMILIMYMVFIK